ncbi:MAG: energy transducer TonB [Prevotella sp.]|nr:energy transducer TonB [Bacteroides sp.]MCM1366694.1 energy transducer TonB [Prevotella sp.]
MAKRNIDLTSKEWRDLVFEDKQKEFGAYKLREQSPKRHNMAALYTLIGLIVIFVLLIAYSKWSDYRDEQRRLELQEQAEKMSQIAMEEAQQEEEQQPEEQKFEQPEVEVKEEVLETVRETQIAIVEQVKEENKVRDTDTKQEDNTARGMVTQEGSDDADKFKAVKEAVVVKEPEPAPEPVKKAEPEQIFTAVEQQAQYPGGQGALMKYLSSNIRYPESAQQNDIQGRVIVKFVVEKDGSIGQAQVVKGVDRALDQEALRVVKKMPRWQPGKNNGVAVRSWFTLPVTFKLQQQ